MKITKDFVGLVDIGWAYKFEGSIETNGSLEIELGQKWLYVTEGIEAGLPGQDSGHRKVNELGRVGPPLIR